MSSRAALTNMMSRGKCPCGWPTGMHQEDSGCQIPYEESGVHVGHCCVEHGCKYGEGTCPVWAGLLTQDHPCEDCQEILSDFLEAVTRFTDDENSPLKNLHSWIYQKDARIIELEERVQAYEVTVGKLLYALEEEAGPMVARLRALLDEGENDV